MKITKYEQSCFLIEIDNKRILIDPGKFCYEGGFKPEDWKDINILLLTHGHSDHCFPEAVDVICKNNKPLIIGSKWVKEELSEKGIPLEILKPGKRKKIDGITITGVKAVHGEHPEMTHSPPEAAIGFLIKGKKHSVYHCGDTLFIKDKPYADVVLVPISNDWVTMGPKEAAIFVKEINPKVAIPMHYYKGSPHPMDPTKFADEMKDSNIKVLILNPGEVYEE